MCGLQATHELEGLNVEVQKNHNVVPRPKTIQRIEIYKKKKKAFGFLIKKKGGRPKSMDGQALDLTKKRKEKVQPNPQRSGKIARELGEKTRPRYLGIPRSLGSSRCAVRLG